MNRLPGALERELNEQLEALLEDRNIRSAVIRLEKPSRNLRYQAAVGQARSDSPNPMTPQTSFHVASVNKSMTALLIMGLAESGALGDQSVDAPYVQFGVFPEEVHRRLLVRNNEPVFHQVSLRHLLTHTAGLRDAMVDDGTQVSDGAPAPGSIMNLHRERDFRQSWQPWLAEGDAHAKAGVINFYLGAPRMNEALSSPGERFHYSDTGFVLLALLVEHLTNRSYAQNLREKLLSPGKLKDSYLAYRDDPPLGPKRAPESDVHLGRRAMLSEGADLSFDWGGGGLVSTVSDLVTFQQALASGFYVSMDSLAMMTDWQIPQGLNPPRSGVGLGLFRNQYELGSLWGHSGAWGAKMFADADADCFVAGTVNQSNADKNWHHGLVSRFVRETR